MKKINLVVSLAIVAVSMSSYVLWQSLATSEQQELAGHGKNEAAQNGMVGTANTDTESHAKHEHGGHANSWQSSPFQISGAPISIPDFGPMTKPDASVIPEPEKEVVSAEELARRNKMAALGYMVPTDYYTKDLRTLRKLAKTGDAYAMVHLGEKYYFELNGQTTNPEFEQGVDYPAAAKQSFKDALVAGNVRSAGIIAELYFQEKNATEAYAWHLISDQLGDDISANWFRRTEMAQQATPEIKQAAAVRAAQIMNELKLSKKSS